MPLISVQRTIPNLPLELPNIYVQLDQESFLMTLDEAQRYINRIKLQLTTVDEIRPKIFVSETGIYIGPEGAKRLIVAIQKQLQVSYMHSAPPV